LLPLAEAVGVVKVTFLVASVNVGLGESAVFPSSVIGNPDFGFSPRDEIGIANKPSSSSLSSSCSSAFVGAARE
jgi:hypothetical protein